MAKAKSLHEKVESALKDDFILIADYNNEIATLSDRKPSREYTKGGICHIARLIINQTDDLLYYFDAYMALPKDYRTTCSLEVLTLRHGGYDIALRKQEEQIDVMASSSKKRHSEMNEFDKKAINPSNIECYIKKYGDTQDAYDEHKKYLRYRSELSREAIKKSNKTMADDPTLRTTSLEYWIRKNDGDEEAARNDLKRRQGAGSLENFKKRHGEKLGYKKWKERQRKWQRTLKSKSDEEIKEINRKKNSGVSTNNVSQSSVNVFERMENDLGIDMVYGSKGEEFSMCYNGRNWFYYDCLVKSHDIIIEYHGECFHPRPMQYDWVCVVNNKTYREVRLNDLRKRKHAIDNGYAYVVLWDSESYETMLFKVKEALDGK